MLKVTNMNGGCILHFFLCPLSRLKSEAKCAGTSRQECNAKMLLRPQPKKHRLRQQPNEEAPAATAAERRSTGCDSSRSRRPRPAPIRPHPPTNSRPLLLAGEELEEVSLLQIVLRSLLRGLGAARGGTAATT